MIVLKEFQTDILILTSQYDFATDRVCNYLIEQNVHFLRINIEQATWFRFQLNPIEGTLLCEYDGKKWFIDSNLKSVWWRQATFYREFSNQLLSLDEQFCKSQWTAFMRGLMLFRAATWINHPAATYEAESKPVQLNRAVMAGFDVPSTIITNDRNAGIDISLGDVIAVKSIDTVLLREETKQHFGYTNIVKWTDCANEHLYQAPITCQKFIEPKLDLRVTVIKDTIWCVSITHKSKRISGDWRTRKKVDLQFSDFELPNDITLKCIQLTKDLGLKYSAIDLALSNGIYWFIEVNPTGEWGWLDCDGREIAYQISKELIDAKLD